ncbi:hypothetical protein F4808DRAFT_444249 [Astrocystis sublimbata]|nr:hypothetical protein F4808DRAFT_444249 [Astrocystis sublimbata]
MPSVIFCLNVTSCLIFISCLIATFCLIVTSYLAVTFYLVVRDCSLKMGEFASSGVRDLTTARAEHQQTQANLDDFVIGPTMLSNKKTLHRKVPVSHPGIRRHPKRPMHAACLALLKSVLCCAFDVLPAHITSQQRHIGDEAGYKSPYLGSSRSRGVGAGPCQVAQVWGPYLLQSNVRWERDAPSSIYRESS